MGQFAKRKIGQILLDGSFLSRRKLDKALEEQKRTKELLGQVLVRMGLLTKEDVTSPLLLQGYLGDLRDATRVAAGERKLLGALLVQSGKITSEQLNSAIAEQESSGERLGEVFVRLGMLDKRQLMALLDFQFNQTERTDGPLRIGELLIASGHLSREQLTDALAKQRVSGKKIGKVLVEEGYVRPAHIRHGIRLQNMLVKSALAAILSISMSAVSFASSVSLQWDPNTESDLAGYKVYYAADSNSFEGVTPIDVQKQTSATIANLDPSKSYNFAVTAYNSAGVESPYSNVVAVAELSPPTVDITSPTDGNSVSGTVSINVSAADNVGVTKVEFYVNGQLAGADTASPYVYSWNTTALPSGGYTLLAKAYDAAGNVSQSSKTVNVVNDTIPPTVSLTAPADNAIVSGSITINASASDNVGVSMVEVYANGVLVFAANASPYSFVWDTKSVANGNYTLYARASDNSGNVKNSLNVTVTVNNSLPDVTAPVVSSFIMPATAGSLTVPVSGFAVTDDRGVAGYLVTESATKPAATAAGWSSTTPESFTFSGEGSRTAYAWAKDAAGNVSAAKWATTVISLYKTVISDVMLVDTSTQYATIQDAYNTVTNTATIATKDVTLTGDVAFNRSVDVTLDGGLDSSFQTSTGTTAVSGSIKISKGKVVLKKIVVR